MIGTVECGGIRALYEGAPKEATNLIAWLELGREAVLPVQMSPEALHRTEQRAVVLQLERLAEIPETERTMDNPEWIDFLLYDNQGDIRKALERYVVYPGQATAYTIGKLKIMELRDRARAELGKSFDIRTFHEVILASGPVPLDVMEENVDAWIAARR